MAKKPGSWKKINKLTGKTRVVSTNGKFRLGIFSFLFLAGTTSFGVSSYFFMSKIIDHDGIQTTGKLPDWNLKSGNGFEVDFAKAPIHHIKDDVIGLQSKNVYDNEGNFLAKEYKDPSLRLQYAYNEIINTAAYKYISENIIYKTMYPDASKIEILNIYTDEQKTKKLNVSDVSSNNFDILNCLLFLEIKYNGQSIDKTVVMPTIFYGNEGFLSNFLQFNLLNNMQKNAGLNDEPVIRENRSSILGAQSSSVLIDVKNDFDNKDRRTHTNNLYKTYADVFDDFFEENKYTEFAATKINPYSNFVISGANTEDELISGVSVNDKKELLDINKIFSLGKNMAEKDSYESYATNYGIESVKHLQSFFLFFKNIYVNSDMKFAFSDNYFDGTILQGKFKDNDNRYVTTSMEEKLDNDQFYFMFLPDDLSVNDLLNKLRSEIIDIVKDASTSNGENIGELMLETFDNIKNDLLKKGSKSKHWWLFEKEFLPFQTYLTSENKDYEVSKQPLTHDTNGSKIDIPNLNEIIIKDKAKYDLNDSEDIVKVFSDLWSTSLYGNDIDEIELDSNSFDDVFLFDGWFKNAKEFLSNLESGLTTNLIPSFSELEKKFDFSTQFLDEYNKPIEKSNEAYSVDVLLKSKTPNENNKSLNKLTFRMKINWTN